MKAKKFARTQRVDVLPLIDLVFLILVFFVLSTLNMTLKRGLDVDLARASNSRAATDRQPPQVLTITRDRAVYLNKRRVAMDNLALEIKRLTEGTEDVTFSIKGDESAPYGVVVAVVGALQEAGINSILMEADQ